MLESAEKVFIEKYPHDLVWQSSQFWDIAVEVNFEVKRVLTSEITPQCSEGHIQVHQIVTWEMIGSFRKFRWLCPAIGAWYDHLLLWPQDNVSYCTYHVYGVPLTHM